ncbi:MAG: hypothetical protein K1X72_25355 [Pyrinomonadaceae bacterium]|nr:hypothetical protein [Pyrinomonadaceae bacterium]
MAIRWKNIKITDKSGKNYLNFQARKFVQSNCPDAISNIERQKLADVVRVKLSEEKTSLDLQDIKDVLSTALGKIGARLSILEDKSESRSNLPVARGTKNVINVNPTRLKVEFIYTRDPKGLSPRAYLEDSKVTVTALREGTTQLLTKITDKGIADFGVVMPGKYKITVDYPETDRCKYDWIDKKRESQLKSGTEEIIEFQVEPLYQQVEFIAHCLLTIPNQIYKLADEDKDKAEIVEAIGRKSLAFKSKLVPVGIFTKSDLNPQVPYAYGEFKTDTKSGTVTLTFKKKRLPEVGCWEMKDLDPEFLTKNAEAIEIGKKLDKKLPTDPDAYEVKFKQRFSKEEYKLDDLKGGWKAEYHGYVKDIEDIDARIKLIEYVLEKAFTKSRKEPTVLKVFMVPECFFQGLYGAYITDDAAKLIEKLQQLVKNEKWKDWVFGFGTVNRVFLGLQPNSVMKENKTIYEMANHAPVIRGGLGDLHTSGEGSTRLIQKLVNSAELADEDTLIKNEEAEKIRPQAVNEKVQFEATENDNKVAKLLEKLLLADISDSFGLPKELWDDLKKELKAVIGELGIARVVRQIRTSINDDINGKALTDWTYTAKDLNKTVVDVLYRSKKTCLPTLDQATLLILKTQWKKLYPKVEFAKEVWAEDTGERQIVIEQVLSDFENVAKECGFRLEYQQKQIKEKIEALEVSDIVAKDFVPDTLNLSFEPSIFPIWRKLLELYAVRVSETVPFEFGQGSMNLEDYCFAGPRKPGPWFANLNEAKGKLACKRIVFGLEICADHTSKRLFALNQKSNESNDPVIGIDIHLLPSAGMTPMYVAARAGGYIFNCDGWSKAHNDGGKKIEIHLDGPSPFVDPLTNGTVSPVYPHSALAKRTDPVKLEIASRESPTEPVEELVTDLSKVIFGYGAGELHFYPPQDLPK